MRLGLAAAILLAVAASATAQGLSDAEGDGGSADIASVSAVLGETATVHVRFTSSQSAETTALRGTLVAGEPGAAEPVEWYQFTLANETHVFAGHGTPRDVEVVASSWNGSVATLEFRRSEPASASCLFAVAESGTFGPGGFEVLDVAPKGFASLEAAWPVPECPSDGAPLGEDVSVESEKGSPALGLGLVAALGVALLVRRR